MPVNVLHLSDLHFGAEPVADKVTSTALKQRQNTLDALLESLAAVEPEWKPHIIVVSGDLAWKGTESDYKEATSWLKTLLQRFGIGSDKLVMCAGNHDINRRATLGLARSVSTSDADEILKPENIGNFLLPFSGFSQFCIELNVAPLQVGDAPQHYLFGQREVLGLRFLILNSAWFCRGDDDSGKLWLGLPQLEVMNANGLITKPNRYDQEPVTISLVHHPQDWLTQPDQYGEGDRKNTYQYLSDRCHVILSGHVHGKVERPTRVFNRAFRFTGGASYAGNDYRNNFSILQVDPEERTLRRRSFEFDPREDVWNPIIDPEIYSFKSGHNPQPVPFGSRADAVETYNYSRLTEKARDHARAYVEQKSWAIMRSSALPKTLHRQVAAHNRAERIAVDLHERLHLNTKGNVAPLDEMVSSERPTFLFGDLGSGKSTLVGEFVIDLSYKQPGLIPLLVPARFFADKPLRTLALLASSISDFVSEQIAPSVGRFDLQRALQEKNELTVVLDGVDELDRAVASQLLFQFEELTRQWAGLRVIATGRPVELMSLNYNYWQCLEILPLTMAEKRQLLVNEAVADGNDLPQAEADAQERLRVLQEHTELLSIADTPLTVRLLRPALNENAKQKSLGDLLYDLLQERLGNWSVKTGRDEQLAAFRKYFPDALSREGLLGQIAFSVHNSPSKSITRASLHALLEASLPDAPDRAVTVKEGCDFFCNNVLHREHGNTFVFPSQPILQCALGIHILARLSQGEQVELLGGKYESWREHSFAATLARRNGRLETVRGELASYCLDLMNDERPAPAVAMIVSEAKDATLAGVFINALKERGFRPIRWFSDAQAPSAAAFADSIRLASRSGFDWYYEEYLNPIYPLDHTEADIAAEVLRHWLMSASYQVDGRERELLSRLMKPHMAAQSWAAHKLLPVVIFAVPEACDASSRIQAYAEALIYSTLRARAAELLRAEAEAGNRPGVLEALEKVSCRSDDMPAVAARLWLELSEDSPPVRVVRSIIAAAASPEQQRLYLQLELRIGKDNLKSLLRWYVFEQSKLSASAAVKLYELGERDLITLGAGLVEGLHDGGLIGGAEEVLHDIVRDSGRRGLVWLAEQFTRGHHDGAPSAYWRLLLAALQRLDTIEAGIFLLCIPSLGQFILARYPEIRRAFCFLLTSKPEYRQSLRSALLSLDPVISFAAGCVLLTAFPEVEADAAEVVVRGAGMGYGYYEFYPFCLRLAAGQTVTQHLDLVADSMVGRSKTFALALLYHNGWDLDAPRYRQLILGLVGDVTGLENSWPAGSGSPKQVLAQEKTFPILLECLDQEQDTAAKAADVLLKQHKERLTVAQYARCWTLAITRMDFWSQQRLDAEADRLRKPEFVDEVERVAQSSQRETRKEPLTSIYARTFSDPSAWNDLLWQALFDDRHRSFIQQEHFFMWLFRRARRDAWSAQALGAAATAVLEDSRLADKGTEEACWLAFIGHEYGGLPAAALERVVMQASPDHVRGDVVAALLARLAYMPTGFKAPAHRIYLTYDSGLDLSARGVPDAGDLSDVVRDAGELHPHFAAWLEWTLLTGAFSDTEIVRLSLESKIASLFTMLLSFCRGIVMTYDAYIIPARLELSQRPGNQQAAIIARAGQLIRRSMAEDPVRQCDFLSAVEVSIPSGDQDAVPDLCSFLLSYRGKISLNLMQRLFSVLIRKSYLLTPLLAEQLAEYFAGVDVDQKLGLAEQVQGVVKVLGMDQQAAPAYDSGMLQTLFALASFVLCENADGASIRLFLLGMRSTLIPQGRMNHNGVESGVFGNDVLDALCPLFEKASAEILGKCISAGLGSDMPQVKSMCRILTAFVGHMDSVNV